MSFFWNILNLSYCENMVEILRRWFEMESYGLEEKWKAELELHI